MRSWYFFGGSGSWLYGLYDGLRDRLNNRLSRLLGAEAVSRSNSIVLEAGSGPGYASSLLKTYANVSMSIALDIDFEALREGRRRDPDLTVVLADIYHPPFGSACCDLVWSNSSLEHLAAPARAVGEMQRVTREGGGVFVGVPYRYGILGFQSWIRFTKIGIWIGAVFDRSQLASLLVQQQLVPEWTRTCGLTCFVGWFARKQQRSGSVGSVPEHPGCGGPTSRTSGAGRS